jgi:methyltransferase-like protein
MPKKKPEGLTSSNPIDLEDIAERIKKAVMNYRLNVLEGNVYRETQELDSEGKLRKTTRVQIMPSEQYLRTFDLSPEQEEFRIVVDVALPDEDYSFLADQTEEDL